MANILFAKRVLVSGGHTGLILGLFCLAFHLGVHSAYAAESKVYEVNNVLIDATAESAATARQLALAVGEREAFHRLIRRITPQEYHSQLPNPDQATISTYVRDFSVSDEKTSSVRYLANMHVRFRNNDIRQLLSEFGIPFSETISKPVLVIPVIQQNGFFSLWEETNLWRQIWTDVENGGRMVPFSHPVGDLADISTVGAQHALSGDLARLQKISKRYNSGSVLVVSAFIDTSSVSYKGLEVQIAQYGPNLDGQTRTYRFTSGAEESWHTLLTRTVTNVSSNLEESWKRDNLMYLDDRGVLPVSVPITSLPVWIKLKHRISQAAVISKTEIVLLSREEARVNLHFLGNLRQLTVALAQNDLQLTQLEGAWIIEDTR